MDSKDPLSRDEMYGAARATALAITGRTRRNQRHTRLVIGAIGATVILVFGVSARGFALVCGYVGDADGRPISLAALPRSGNCCSAG